jgi:DNA-binding HxlR family transcriptional regulator
LESENIDDYDMIKLLETLGSKWNLMIIWNLQEETFRFTKLQKRMGNVNSKTLTDHLRYLEKYNIIKRVIYPEVPPRVEYSLTEHGKAFLPLFLAIKEWGRSLPPPKDKQD